MLYIRANRQLTEIAKGMFGDILDTVYVSCYRSGDGPHKDVLQELDGVDEMHSNIKEDGIRFDPDELLLKFTNGKIVQLSSSELGYLTAADPFTEITR